MCMMLLSVEGQMNFVHIAYIGIFTAASLGGMLLSGLLNRSPATSRWAAACSAGVLLGIGFLYLLPEAFAFLGNASKPLWGVSITPVHIGCATALGFLLLLSIERYLLNVHNHAPCVTHDHETHSHADAHHDAHERGATWSVVLALCIHSFFDGLAMRMAQDIKTLGPALALGLVLHKIPEAASLFTILKRGGVRTKGQVLVYLFYLVSTPLGLLTAHQLHQVLSQSGIALIMAFAAGALLHLVTGHLLPEATESKSKTQQKNAYGIMLGGFFVMMVARLLAKD